MAKIRESIISNCEKSFVLKNLQEDTRLDGRAFNEFRELSIDFGKDWGSCLVSLGKTRALAQVSCEVQQPKSSRPSEGILNINVELTPLGAAHFEAGRQSELSVQLNRALEKCIKDSKAVDLESLCIKVSEKAWALRVDVNILNHEGNLVDCASVAALAALAHFRRPDVTCDGEEMIIHSYAERDPIPTVLHHYPVCITYAVFNEGTIALADPNLLEEGVSDAHLTVALNAYKELCSLHLGGSSFMTAMDILHCTTKAASRVSVVVQLIKDAIGKDKKDREQNRITSFEDSLQFSEEINFAFKDMEEYLNRWSVKEQRHRKKNFKAEQMEVDSKDNVPNGTVESLGAGSAALLPKEEPNDVWTISSDEEAEEDVIPDTKQIVTSKEKMEVINVDDSSEEEEVVVLNAGNTKQKKHII